MASIFVPFNGSKPASVVINGHRLVILSRDSEDWEDRLGLVGADTLEVFEEGASPEDTERTLQTLARMAEGGVVVAPSDVDVEEVIKNLESQLPWVN